MAIAATDRWVDLQEEDVPPVPVRSGPRVMGLLSAMMVLLGLAFLVLTALAPAALLDSVGLADRDTATVTDHTYHEVIGVKGGCDYHRIEVAWDGRTGRFDVCNNPDYPATRLEPGDTVRIVSVPWSSEVTAEGAPGDLFWGIAGLVSGLGLVVVFLGWLRRYRRVALGRARGVRLAGRVTWAGREHVQVRLETPGLLRRTLVLLPAKSRPRVQVSDRVQVWSTRRGLFTRRPAGPWVVERDEGELVLFTHGWLRRVRPLRQV